LSATKLQPLSPSSIPLPESPISSPKVEVSDPDPITFLAVEPLLPLSLGAPDAAPPNEVNEQILVEADIPCPQSPTEGARQEVAQPDLDNAPVIPDESSVYVLQERLRLFEQRFAGGL
jgi:hypothetical protein